MDRLHGRKVRPNIMNSSLERGSDSPMEPIGRSDVEAVLAGFADKHAYIHMETTRGAYTRNTYGAFARNVKVLCRRAVLGGDGPYRIGVKIDEGWLFAEGVTHWRFHGGQLLFAGFDDEGRLTVAFQMSEQPFDIPGRGWEPTDVPADETGAAGEISAGRGGAEAAGAGLGPSGPGLDPDVPLPPALEDVKSLLVILAHPDDESFGTAGSMALLRARGIPVAYICVTGGQMGRHMGVPPTGTRESLPWRRRLELDAAMAAVGVTDVHRLGMWDKTVEFEDEDALARRIGAIMNRMKPSHVITFHTVHSGHPDHMAVGRAAFAAVRELPPGRRPRVWCPAVRSDEIELDLPLLVVDVQAAEEAKRAAFFSHKSQVTGWEEKVAESETLSRRFGRMFREERFWVCTDKVDDLR